MMSQTRHAGGTEILRSLATVEAERVRRSADPALAQAVRELKAYQQERFRVTHADLVASPRYGAAARFFLDELYGPGDFSRRDAQFGRIVPALVRLFPAELVHTVGALAALHALSEELDSAMACALPPAVLDAAAYARAWRAIGRASDRQRQVDLVIEVGQALDRYTRVPSLMMSLKMMRTPARLAGLSELQHFLEHGFDTFKTMRGAQEFLGTIEARERALISALFTDEASGQFP